MNSKIEDIITSVAKSHSKKFNTNNIEQDCVNEAWVAILNSKVFPTLDGNALEKYARATAKRVIYHYIVRHRSPVTSKGNADIPNLARTKQVSIFECWGGNQCKAMPDHNANIELELAQQQMRDRIQNILNRLPDGKLAAQFLLDNYPAATIAKTNNCRVKSVYNAVRTAKKHLRRDSALKQLWMTNEPLMDMPEV